MAVRLANSTDDELSVGSGLDLESRSVRRKYQILGQNQPDDALRELAEAYKPPTLLCPLTRTLSLPIQKLDGSVEYKAVTLYRQPLTVTRLGDGIYESDVIWNLRSNTEFEVNVRGRTSGGQQKLIGSFFTAGKFAAAGSKLPIPDYKQVIAYNPKTQEAEGCEVFVPEQEYEVEVRYPIGYVTEDYLTGLDDLVGYVNLLKWRRWDAGRVVYRGAEYSYGNNLPVTIVHIIGLQRNLKNVTLAGIPGITKDGWDFLWYLTQDKDVPVGDGNIVRIKKAQYAFVERVFPRRDFKAVLGF